MKHPKITIIEYNDAIMVLELEEKQIYQGDLTATKQYKENLKPLLLRLKKNRMERIEYLSE